MRYMLLIYTNEAEAVNATQEQQMAVMEAYNAYTAEVQQSGALRAGEALHPTAMATTVRVSDGKTVTTDGPFAETKEQLGGVYMVECANLDGAMQWAAKIPGAKGGWIEVGAVMEFNGLC